MNLKLYRKIDPVTKLTMEVQSKNLKVGDVIYV